MNPDWKKAVSSLAADITGISARAAESGREEELYPEAWRLFMPDQFMTEENLRSLFAHMEPYVPYLIQDRLTMYWAGLSLEDFKILAGPFSTEVISWHETGAILRFHHIDMKRLEDFNRYVFYSRLVSKERVLDLFKAYCHLFSAREPGQPVMIRLLQGNPFRQMEENPNKYAEHYQDMEAAYSAAIAHGNQQIAEEILRKLQEPYLHLQDDEPGAAFRDISGFTTQLTYARIAGRRAGVPAEALDAAFRKYQERAIRIHDRQMLLQLSYEATRTFCELVNSNSRHTYSSNVRNAIDYLERNFQEAITLKDAAAQLGVNASSLSCAFHRETGKTLTEYLNRIRLEHSRILLSMNDFSIRDICAGSGFSDQSYYTKLFRETYGITPTEYRRELIGKDQKALRNR